MRVSCIYITNSKCDLQPQLVILQGFKLLYTSHDAAEFSETPKEISGGTGVWQTQVRHD